MKLTILGLLLFLSQVALGETLSCEAWFQQRGKSVEQKPMLVKNSSVKNTVLEVTFHGFSYKVDWNVELTTLYTFIKKGGKNILFSTARVPSKDHNDSFTDMYLPDGTRLSVSCMFE